jgi:hypothetical protein
MHNLYIHRFEVPVAMPLRPVVEHMETFNAGAVTIGVEFRILTEELIAALGENPNPDFAGVNDVGVSIHVFVQAADGDLERVRFDCFEDDPHYHYVDWPGEKNELVFIDPIVNPDVLAWALATIRSRLPQMLERAGIANAEELVDRRQVEKIMPLVTEAAYRARFHTNTDRITIGAINDARRISVR